jgi:hypothetical protein
MGQFPAGWRRRTRWGAAAIGAMALALGAATTHPAGATVLIQNHTDPAGDPAVFSYHLDLPGGLPPSDFALRDGEEQGFGPFAGQVVAVDLPPAGWHVADVRCVGPSTAAFVIDVAAGRVTMQHGMFEEQICSFTNRRNASSAAPDSSLPSPAPGIAPAPPTSALRHVVAPRRATLIAVLPRRRGATARVVLVQRSLVKTQLLWHGRVVGVSRVVRPPGMYDVTVPVRRSVVGRWRHARTRRVTLTMRMVVVPLGHGATTVLRSGVIVPL